MCSSRFICSLNLTCYATVSKVIIKKRLFLDEESSILSTVRFEHMWLNLEIKSHTIICRDISIFSKDICLIKKLNGCAID